MKKYLTLLLLLYSVAQVRAQAYKVFLDADGKRTDSAKAVSYIISRKFTDTSWLMQQYDKHNTIMQAGTFKDKDLHIADGKFVYYSRLYIYKMKLAKFSKPTDTINYLKTYGSFKNGLKDGWWIDYFRNGNKEYANYFVDGKLNGRSESYNRDFNTILVEGNNLDDTRNGEWHIYNPHGVIIQTDTYYRGKLLESKKTYPPYNPPKAPDGFNDFIDLGIRKLINNPADMQLTAFRVVVSFDVDSTGKLSNPKISGKGYKKDFDKELLAMLANSPLWIPANAGEEKKAINDNSLIAIQVSNNRVMIKILDADQSRFYNIMH